MLQNQMEIIKTLRKKNAWSQEEFVRQSAGSLRELFKNRHPPCWGYCVIRINPGGPVLPQPSNCLLFPLREVVGVCDQIFA